MERQLTQRIDWEWLMAMATTLSAIGLLIAVLL